jgi:hypothetical protein
MSRLSCGESELGTANAKAYEAWIKVVLVEKTDDKGTNPISGEVAQNCIQSKKGSNIAGQSELQN